MLYPSIEGQRRNILTLFSADFTHLQKPSAQHLVESWVNHFWHCVFSYSAPEIEKPAAWFILPLIFVVFLNFAGSKERQTSLHEVG